MTDFKLTLQPHHYTAQAKVNSIPLDKVYEILPIAQMHHSQAVIFFTHNNTFFKLTAAGFITLLGSDTIKSVRENFIFVRQLLRKIDDSYQITSFSVFQSLITGDYGKNVDLNKFCEITGADFDIEARFGAKYTKIQDGKRFIITVQPNGSFVILGCRSTEEAEQGLIDLQKLGIERCFYGTTIQEIDSDKLQ
ncbi:TATA-binding protein (TBP) [Spironucleus salmonicida]|uniref:TATA-binding protein (TBP) n=1 Tax=Spironucleus salmonicida TaxID=348837 RepID=V6LRN9_9EUKA|nr:TATA-binding protein (TBP) [Spironucleus salmonicida]|eukprot:EST46928.1 TATA-binding protein (TBP) [Spironucleus salmonicida]